MLLIRYETVNETKGEVNFIHYRPDELSLKEKEAGILIDATIPEPKIIDYKSPVLCINPKTKELWYEYIDRPKTEDEILREKVNQLEGENSILDQQLVEKDLQVLELQQQNNTLGQQLVDMDLRLLNLEMGGNA